MRLITDIKNIELNSIMYYFDKNNNNKVSFSLKGDERFTFRSRIFKQSSKGEYIIFEGKRYYYPYGKTIDRNYQ